MMEISQPRRDSHIPTTTTTVRPKDKNQELLMRAVEKWKSKSRIPTFPPPRQPAAQGELPHRQRGTTAQRVDPGRLRLLGWLRAHDWSLGRHPDGILQRHLALV